MDPDQHRQKRSRLRSADGNNDLSQRDAATEDDAMQAGPSSPARVLAATNALRDISLQDSQPPVVQTHNPTPPASFITQPSSHQNGAPSSQPSFNNNNSVTFNPTPPQSFAIAGNAAHNARPRPRTPSNLHASSIRPGPGLGAFDLPLHGSRPEDRLFPRSPPAYPPNYYTSPFRVENAATIASRKRKRGWPALPPPAYIYKRTNSPGFNVFGGILLYPELCFALAANLPVNDLVSLYAISKDFHTIIDTRFATVIRSQAMRKCPESLRTFPARCYKYLCRPDPSPRIPHPHPAKQAAGEIRRVPSFRWLKMILFREKVCHEIMALMAEDGVPLPSRCELALKKMWFLMDIPDNARRIGYMHTAKLMTDLDLYFMMCFVVKLDMRFHDPLANNRYHGLRKLLLAQRGLLPLWRALKRTDFLTRSELLMMYVTTKSAPVPDEEGLPMFGISEKEIGKLRMEYWGERSTHDTGKPCTFLLRPDQLFMREIVRRKMVFSKHFIRCLLWGYVNVLTMKDYPSRVWDRKILNLDDEYQDDDECGGYCDLRGSVTNELLDLAAKKPVSMLVTQRDQSGVRKEAFLEECMKWYLEERQRT
ncbi:hypothetical protein GJ744_004921 [Endocarpon pusillum]|uniref:Uncharacterized protein n=1 Tax=Endocarpon pusillum TaxID=364733 RepID=A0A8H7AQT6_9EURO|nr:hypothetical protein GJ744_004921 [Endocarpon pusillum]